MGRILCAFFVAVLVLCLSPPAFAANETEARTELTFIYAPSSPTYTVEMDGSWKKGTQTGLTITTNGDISKFVGVKIDDVLIDPSNYMLSGSFIITLMPEFLETLTVGEHSIEILFADGNVQTVFTILVADPPKNPGSKDKDSTKIGDNSNMTLWICLSGMLFCFGGLVIARRKRKGYNPQE